MKKTVTALLVTVSMIILNTTLLGCNPSDPTGPIQTPEVPEIPITGVSGDLMRDIIAKPVSAKTLDNRFYNAAANFSLDLFRATISDDENSLISPTSVLLALAMTANGADGNTLAQMEKVIGGGMSIDELNAYLYAFVNSLESKEKELLNISNSIWFKENNFAPYLSFLQTNANYYGADAFAAPFNKQTVLDINNWISDATDGLIEEMLNEIPEDVMMYLINTVLFDAEWERIYEKEKWDVRSGWFTNHNNQVQTVEFMHSIENIFIQGNGAKGFIKPYHSNRYSFAAILPDEGIDIHSYVAGLSGETFLSLIKNAQLAEVITALPKFDYEYEIAMNDALKAMGMPDAFCRNTANLLRMGRSEVGGGRLHINKVLHKTRITVDELGTKASAATGVGVIQTSALHSDRVVKLDRPFVYAIIDNDTNLPIFIGTYLSVK